MDQQLDPICMLCISSDGSGTRNQPKNWLLKKILQGCLQHAQIRRIIQLAKKLRKYRFRIHHPSLTAATTNYLCHLFRKHTYHHHKNVIIFTNYNTNEKKIAI